MLYCIVFVTLPQGSNRLLIVNIGTTVFCLHSSGCFSQFPLSKLMMVNWPNPICTVLPVEKML